jgi:8-oxo-dGTP diphosphatase
LFSEVTVSAVALLDPFHRVLVGQRSSDGPMPSLWEFPGGKRREAETTKTTARREILEELGLTIREDKLAPFAVVSHQYETFDLSLHLFVCREWTGEPVPIVHSSIRWVPLHLLSSYPMPPADEPLVAKLTSAFL